MAQPSRRVLSANVVQLVKQARQEAARQGCMFVGLPHLVLGLLSTPSRATDALSRWVSAEDARAALDAQVLMPLSSATMSIQDVDMSTVAREAIAYGHECAREQGSTVMGCGHLAVVLTQDDRSPLRSMLQARQAPIRALEEEILEVAQQHPEEPEQATPSPEEQVAQLRRLAVLAASSGKQQQQGATWLGSQQQDQLLRQQVQQQRRPPPDDEYE